MTTKQPSDKSHFILPDLGEGVHEAEIIRWRVTAGETVEEHQTLAEMETDKALVEVPSPWSGVIKELHGSEGEIINVGSRLVSYDVGGGAESPGSAGNGEAAAPADGDATARDDAGTVVGSVGASLQISDRFKRRQSEIAGVATAGKALATPAVRRIARELGLDINTIAGTGRGGRVTASDVYAFTSGGAAPATPQRPAGTPPPIRQQPATTPALRPAPVGADGISQRIPIRGIRRKIAQALDQSVRTAVHFTVVDEANVTALDRKRKEYATVIGAKLSFLPFVMNAVCKALRQHPTVNANVDDQAQEILVKAVINLGCAVDTDHGLMVPVISDADQLSIVQLDTAVGDVATRSRNRTIAREELVGGTFTISNVGSFGGIFATPIINYPEVGILAVGRAKERVLVQEGMFYAGKILPLSLSCDHRVVDGAEGARFLSTIVKLLESPESLVE